MSNCGSCTHWTRDRLLHGRTKLEHGQCGKISSSAGRGAAASDRVTISVDGWEWDEAHLSTHEKFGCVLHEPDAAANRCPECGSSDLRVNHVEMPDVDGRMVLAPGTIECLDCHGAGA